MKRAGDTARALQALGALSRREAILGTCYRTRKGFGPETPTLSVSISHTTSSSATVSPTAE